MVISSLGYTYSKNDMLRMRFKLYLYTSLIFMVQATLGHLRLQC